MTNSGCHCIAKWGSYGTGDGKFFEPQGIAVNSSGYVYVVDSDNDRAQYFMPSGEFVGKWGNEGRGDGRFRYPSGISVNSSDYVYVADSRIHRVQYFTPTGEFVSKWGSFGDEDGLFDYPQGIAVNSSDYVFVIDGGNHRVQYFTPTGEFVGKWGSEGTGDGQFSYPTGIATNSFDYLYVNDISWKWEGFDISIVYDRVQYFTPLGEFVGKCGSWKIGAVHSGYNGGITIDSFDNLYKVDDEEDQIQVFAPPL